MLNCGDDLANLEAAVQVSELNPEAAIHARVYKKSFADRISAALSPNIHTFSPYATAARTLLSQINSTDDKTGDRSTQ